MFLTRLLTFCITFFACVCCVGDNWMLLVSWSLQLRCEVVLVERYNLKSSLKEGENKCSYPILLSGGCPEESKLEIGLAPYLQGL